MRISDWSSDVCSSDLGIRPPTLAAQLRCDEKELPDREVRHREEREEREAEGGAVPGEGHGNTRILDRRLLRDRLDDVGVTEDGRPHQAGDAERDSPNAAQARGQLGRATA